MQKINNIIDSDYKDVYRKIIKYDLSYYELNKEDFSIYKKDDKIVAFWRVFNIGWDDYELSSLWVDDEYRWKRLWIELIDDLIKDKFNKKYNLFLACKRELEDYYKQISFEIIKYDIPKKLEWTLRWWKENNFDAIIMKYNN